MSIRAAYIGVILIWSTTPLAIHWSAEGVGPVTGLAGRMIIASVICVALLLARGTRLPWHRAALLTYVAGALGLFVGMLPVYWAAQYIATGLISVIFAMTPMVIALMAGFWLPEQGLTTRRVLGGSLGMAGLAFMTQPGAHPGSAMAMGVLAVLLGVISHSASTVAIKRLNAGLPAMVANTGSLVVALPLFLLVMALSHESDISGMTGRSALAILYLGVIGSVLGYSLYFYALRHVDAVKMGLITLMTPVLALMLGSHFNGEQLSLQQLQAAALVLVGLYIHQYGLSHVMRTRPIQA